VRFVVFMRSSLRCIGSVFSSAADRLLRTA
jgi:hypothetical protein